MNIHTDKCETCGVRGLFPALAITGVSAAALLLSGCKGTTIKGEREARQQVQAVSESYRPNGHKPALPVLTTNSTLADFLTYALLNQPKVEAAYFDWLASVERITVERSLPDPQLTFQMDIQDVVTSLMPGLMMTFPGAGKLRAAGTLAAAASQTKYFAFETASLESAYEVKRAYYQLHFLAEKIRVNRETLSLLSDLEKLARAQNDVGKVTLQDVLRAQIEQDRLKNDLANLEDSHGALVARFKAALGMRADEPAPPVPERLESTSLDLTSEKLFETALAHNTRLKGMEAEVRAADAAITQAYKARMPDVTAGFMADVKMSPTLYRPWGTVSLPLWRDKLAAQVAEAQSKKRADEALLSAEQIALAADFAERLFLYREATRNVELLQNQLLPRQRQSLEVARVGYLAGQIDFFNLTDAEQTLLRFGLDEVEARTQRELSLIELSLMIQGLPLSGASIAATPARGMATTGAGMSSGAVGMLPGNSAPPPKNKGGM
ncbi:MAG TPA: TolC family protein [Candidatus Acidoferrum sp.]|jgi:cobalt-zinc-cadmium efflux system outer membrane protein|nr:TolC family protein [Candidatus Acidoferrum sp.]